MVLLTIVTTSNPQTMYFDHPIEKPSYIHLLSASLYNSWYNLKQNASMVYLDLTTNKTFTRTLIKGHYTLKRLAKEIQGAFAAQSVDLKAELNTPMSGMTIYNTSGVNIQIAANLADLLGIEPDLNSSVAVQRLHAPSTYFVHCDLINKRQNLLNGKPLTVLARFDIRGQPFEKVHYQTPQQHVLRDTDNGDYVNSITLSVQDENGNLFDFNNQPLEFEVEINENPIYTHQDEFHEHAAFGPSIQRGSTTIPHT